MKLKGFLGFNRYLPGIVISGFLGAGLLYAFTLLLDVTELMYPVRIDSSHVFSNNSLHERVIFNPVDSTEVSVIPWYSPEQIDSGYQELSIKTADSVNLNAWYFPNKLQGGPVTIIIVHDINESRITYLEHAQQFLDRGFRVCLAEMRAHGTSAAQRFYLGTKSTDDIKSLIDTLSARTETEFLVMVGVGLGATVAIRTAAEDPRVNVLIAQSPFNSLDKYVENHAFAKWGRPGVFLYPLIRNNIESELKLSLRAENITSLIETIGIPTMIIGETDDPVISVFDARTVFHKSASQKKEYFNIKSLSNKGIATEEGDKYFNRISIFTIKSLPLKSQRNKFKKLALL
jgi:esterase/lipase